MGQRIRDVMTPDPISVRTTDTLTDAARRMKEADIGPVLVLDNGTVCGILTDRDITVRAVAEGKNPTKAKVAEVFSKDPTCVTPDQSIDEAVGLMRDKAVRRLPVVENGKPVGIVAIGDLAVQRDPESALASISSARPND